MQGGRSSAVRRPAGSLEGNIFELAARANEVVGAGLTEGGEFSPALLGILFFAGMASSINPCAVATLPAAAASVAALARGSEEVPRQAAAFALGTAAVLASLGFAVAVLGEKLLLNEDNAGPLEAAFPLVAVGMGLSLLGVLPSVSLPKLGGLSSLATADVPRELQSFGLGVAQAASHTPCSTPVLITVISFLSANPQGPVASAALFLAYALGYSAPVAAVSASAGALAWLQAGSSWGPLLSGAAILCVGVQQLVQRVEEYAGADAATTLALAAGFGAAAATAATVAAAQAKAQAPVAPPVAAVPFDIVAVPGQVGVYRYQPQAASVSPDDICTPCNSDSPGVLEQAAATRSPLASPASSASAPTDGFRRTAALAAVVSGIATSGAVRAGIEGTAEAAEEDRPERLLLDAFRRSPSLSTALRSGRPVVVDFSATWCPDCLKSAPAMRELERRFDGSVEFVTVDVTSLPTAGAETQWWAQQFRVDAIPHIAFVDSRGTVLTALCGYVPAEYVQENMQSLADGEGVKYVMFDAFKGRKLEPFPALLAASTAG